jgi:hypothetical protein
MSEHRARVRWERATRGFDYDGFDRTHAWEFGGERRPSGEELARMPRREHAEGFMAHSIRAEVAIELAGGRAAGAPRYRSRVGRSRGSQRGTSAQ